MHKEDERDNFFGGMNFNFFWGEKMFWKLLEFFWGENLKKKLFFLEKILKLLKPQI